MNAMVTTNFAVSDMERMATAFAMSKLFGVTNVEQALALCLIAQAEGRHPASAAQDYHIIQGKPSKKADAMLRDFLSGGGKVEWHKLDDTIADATFSHPAGGSVRIAWDMERAKQAQLATPMWKKFPRQMLRSRTVSEGVRTVFPMATSGMYVPEEVQEFAAPAAPQIETVAVTIDGEIIEPEVPKQLVKVSREAEKQMREEIDSCATVDELKRLWRSPKFQEEYEKLHPTYQDGIVTLIDERTAFLAATPANVPSYVPPTFEDERPFPGDTRP